MKELHARKSGVAAAFVISSALTLQCSQAKAWQPKMQPESFTKSRAASASASASQSALPHPPVPSVLISRWERGNCTFQNNTITYTDNSGKEVKKKSAVFDYVGEDQKWLVCSELFTVVITPKKAVVGLGAAAVLNGVEMLGRIGDTFMFQNSYALTIKEPMSEGLVSASVHRIKLHLVTMAGKTWTIDLASPVEWTINRSQDSINFKK